VPTTDGADRLRGAYRSRTFGARAAYRRSGHRNRDTIRGPAGTHHKAAGSVSHSRGVARRENHAVRTAGSVWDPRWAMDLPEDLPAGGWERAVRAGAEGGDVSCLKGVRLGVRLSTFAPRTLLVSRHG
jgi:hypothetical protein